MTKTADTALTAAQRRAAKNLYTKELEERVYYEIRGLAHTEARKWVRANKAWLTKEAQATCKKVAAEALSSKAARFYMDTNIEFQNKP